MDNFNTFVFMLIDFRHKHIYSLHSYSLIYNILCSTYERYKIQRL